MDLIGTSRLHYEIIEKLGEGGMGVVYKAFDTKLKREVAIKFLPWRIATNADMRTRFQIEAQAVATLNHPNIATIFAIEEVVGPDGQEEIFFVMEFIGGQELKRKIKDGPIPLADALDIALQVAEGLNAAHDKGITHRDIKPANIMLTSKGRVKLMDFGLAKIGRGVQLTKTNTTLGTVAYMSPEQARGEKVDYRSDIWSYGVVLYEMLAGSLPFQADHEHAIIYAIINSDPQPITRRRADIPLPLVRVVEKALQKNPEERYQDLQTLILDLHRFADELFSSLRNDTVLRKKTIPGSTQSLYVGPQLKQPAAAKPALPGREVSLPNEKSKALRYGLVGLFSLITAGGLYVFWGNSSENGPESIPQSDTYVETEIPPTVEHQSGQGDIAKLNPLGTESTDTSENQLLEPEISTQPQQPVTDLPQADAESNPPPDPQTTIARTPVYQPPANESQETNDDGVDLQALQQQADLTRSRMIQAENQVPGDDAFKSKLPSYSSAVRAHQEAQNQYNALNYEAADARFEEARTDYVAAQSEAVAQFRLQAENARSAKDQARGRIGNPEQEDAGYQQALSREEEGEQAYASGDFERAARLYTESQQLFDQLAERSALETERTRQLAGLTGESKQRLARSFESEDIDALEASVNLSGADRQTWQTFFASFRNVQLRFGEEVLREVDPNHFQLNLTSVLTYVNNKNEDKSINLTFSGTIVNENDGWSSSKFNMLFNN